MRIAIVGGSGFIGTQTTLELLEHGHDVTVIDLLPPSVGDVEYVRADVSIYDQAINALNGNFDVVYMFAAISDSNENIIKPISSIQNNIVTLSNVLHAVNTHDIHKIIFSSTVWVYSVTDHVEVDEQTDLPITSSNHIYTTCKLTCEALIRNYSMMFGIKYTILRYGIAFGPGCHPDTILSRFITNALAGKTLTITGDGEIHRNFLYVTDHARGNRLALSSKCDNQIINLEGPEKITLNRVASEIVKLHGDVTISYTDQRQGDYIGKIVNNSRALELMGWSPTVDFTTGTNKLYDHIRQQNTDNSTAC
jgi:UDP-glucose 4-epimerase